MTIAISSQTIQHFMDKGFDYETAEALAFFNDNGQRTLASLNREEKKRAARAAKR